ncbi:MAG TPA: tetratricopeptide repeat protein, partial [Gemmatimonadaceae bacterium]
RQARFELIDLLAKRRAGRELLAELLPLEETPADSVALRRRLGHLFNLAGSPARAATMFRDLIRRVPADVDAYAGLGDAELAMGNFRTARADLGAASRLNPGDTAIVRRLAIADTAASLDPTARGITAAERYIRSREVLMRTLAAIGGCTASSALVDSTVALLGRSPRANASERAADALASRATALWNAKPARCDAAAGDEVLRLLQSRLAQ